MELHPEILIKDGAPQFAVLPYDEFVQIEAVLRHLTGGTFEPDCRYGGFRDNLSAQELARRQGVVPVDRTEYLYGEGDPEDWEGFDDALAQWRAEHPVL